MAFSCYNPPEVNTANLEQDTIWWWPKAAQPPHVRTRWQAQSSLMIVALLPGFYIAFTAMVLPLLRSSNHYIRRAAIIFVFSMAQQDTIASSESIGPFVYDPLPRTSIRLLRRLDTMPGPSGMLEFEMVTKNLGPEIALSDLPRFHCLSYTWGNPHANCRGFSRHFDSVASEYDSKHQYPILCNGKILKIGRSLHDAMQSLPLDCWSQRVRYRYDHLNGQTALHIVAKMGDCGVLKQYLKAEADVDVQDRSGNTALHYAVQYKRNCAAQCLLDANADPKIKDNDDKLPIAYAWENKSVELAEKLVQRMCSFSPLNFSKASVVKGGGSDEFIWIDAICINQEDLEERNDCVMKMDSVYDMADYVLVWLGPEDRSTKLAFDTVRKLAVAGDKLLASTIIPFTSVNSPEDYESQGIPYISKNGWNALAGLFSRQWFRRMWVIQEVAFARDMVMYCGSHCLQYAEIAGIADRLVQWYQQVGYRVSSEYMLAGDIAPSVEYYMHRFCEMRRHRIRHHKKGFNIIEKRTVNTVDNHDPKGSPFSLSNLILATFPFLSTDPRDKIFALLSLWKLDSSPNPLPVANYSMSVQQCYRAICYKLFQTTNDLTFLTWVQDKSLKQIQDLPSWVPDFSLRAANNFITARHNVLPEGLRRYVPHCTLGAKMDWNKWPVTGFRWDTVEAIAGPTQFRTTHKFKLNPHWFTLCLHLNVKYHTGESRTEALWRTLCRNEDAQHRYPAPMDLKDSFKKLVCAMICEKAERRVEEALSMMKALMDVVEHRNGGPSDRSGAEWSIQQARLEMRENICLTDKDFAHVHSLLWILELLSCTELDPNNPSLSQSHTPSPTEIESYFRNPEWHFALSSECRFVPAETGNARYTIHVPFSSDREENSISNDIRGCTAQRFGLAFDSAYEGKRLFVTKGKYIGLGPASVEKGDAVYFLPGARTPFILRRVETEDTNGREGDVQEFAVIGEAYVHGIMDGEGMNPGMKRQDIYLV